MVEIAHASENANPEDLYRKATTPQEKRRIQGAVVERYKSDVAAVARSLLPNCPDHWEDAKQAGLIGLLVALEQYRDGKIHTFWPIARLRAIDEVRSYIGVGVAWHKAPNRGKSPQRAKRREAGPPIEVERASDAVENQRDPHTPEDLYAEAEEKALLESFAGTLSRGDRAVLFADDQRVGGRHRKELVTRARTALRAKDGAQ